MEERIEPKKGAHGLRNTLLVLVGTATLAWTGWVSKTVMQMDIRLQNGGITNLAEAITHPKSPEALRANMTTVVASIQTARANGVKPSSAKLATLSQAVSLALGKDPTQEPGWQAAGELIGYRSASATTTKSPACKQDSEELAVLGGDASHTTIPVTLVWHDCTLRIDDNPMLEDLLELRGLSNSGPPNLVLKNVTVAYNGGRIPNFDTITCTQCTFDFSMTSSPPPTAERVIRALLDSKNIDNVTIKVANG